MKAITIILFSLLSSCSLTVHVHTYEKVTKEDVGFKPGMYLNQHIEKVPVPNITHNLISGYTNIGSIPLVGRVSLKADTTYLRGKYTCVTAETQLDKPRIVISGGGLIERLYGTEQEKVSSEAEKRKQILNK